MTRFALLPALLVIACGCDRGDGKKMRYLKSGNDLFTATGMLRVEVTTNEIAGVLPFTGGVPMVADPFGSRGPFQLGNTNVAITRLDTIRVPGEELKPVDATLAEMSFVSEEPLELTVDGSTKAFVVRAWTAADEDQGVGTVEISDEFYLAELPFRLNVTLTSDTGGTIAMPAGQDDTLNATIGFRVPLSECPTPELEVNGLPIDVCARDVGGSSSATFRFESITLQPAEDDGLVAGTGGDISSTAMIDPSALIGPGTSIGDNASVGPGAVLGQGVSIGAGTAIGANAVIVDGVSIGDDVSIGADTIVDYYTVVGSGVVVGDDVRIGSFGDLGADASVAAGATLGNYVTLSPAAGVAEGIWIAGESVVAPKVIVSEDIVRCELPSGDVLQTSGLECVDTYLGQPGCLSPRPAALLDELAKLFTEQVHGQEIPDDVRGPLTMAIDSAGVGGPTQREGYSIPTNDCDDFAERLEKKLQAAGYDATLTVIRRYRLRPGPAWFWWAMDLPRMDVESAHAITDVHLPDGRTIWIEPQAGMSNESGDFNALDIETTRLDGDGDGTVETSDGPGDGPTDGLLRIEVYPDRASAEAKGVDFD